MSTIYLTVTSSVEQASVHVGLLHIITWQVPQVTGADWFEWIDGKVSDLAAEHGWSDPEFIDHFDDSSWTLVYYALQGVSVDDVTAHELPADATGVYWTDTAVSECVAHLADPSWAAQVEANELVNGVVLHADVDCFACNEAEALS